MRDLTPFGWLVLGILAIIGIVILETFALHKGIDGVALAGVVAFLAGLAGYSIPGILKK